MHAIPPLRRVSVLTPEAGGFYVGDVLRGIDEACTDRNVQAIVVQTAVSWQISMLEQTPIERYVEIARAFRSGLLAITSVMEERQLAAIAAPGEPVIAIAGPAVRPGGLKVGVDNHSGAMAAVRHLLEHGHRRIGFVGTFMQHDVAERYEGYVAALREAGIEPDSHLVFAVRNDLYPGGREAAERILDAGIPLTAIFASTDTHAVSMMEALMRAGVRVPDDVAIVGFDDSELAQVTVPGLSSVRQVPMALGAAATNALVDLIEERPDAAVRLTLPTSLVVRHSCGCFEPHQDFLEASYDWNATDWKETLAGVLVRALLAIPDPQSSILRPSQIWPGVEIVIDAFDGVMRGLPVTNVTALDEAWRAACTRTRNAETLMRLVDLLEFVGLFRQAHGGDPDSLRPRLRGFLAQARLQILRYAAIADPLRHPQAPRITRALVRSFVAGDAVNLEWLRHLEASGCLGLWEPSRADGQRTILRIAERFGRSTSAIPLGATIEPDHFPPIEWLDAIAAGSETSTVTVVPVVTPRHDWGILAVALPAGHRYYDAYWTLQHGVDLLGLALDRTRDRSVVAELQ